MKKILCLLVMLGVSTPLIAQPPPPPPPTNARVTGTIDFFRVRPQVDYDGFTNDIFQFRIKQGTCAETRADGMFINIRSDRLDGVFDDINGITFKQAYTIALVTFLTGQTIQVDNVPNCDVSQTQTIRVQNSGLAIF